MNYRIASLFSFANVVIVATVVFGCGHWSDARADDTDLFFGRPSVDSTTPNVLLFIDNSDSMQEVVDPRLRPSDPGFGENRADVLIDVATNLLNSVAGVDVGIGTFNGRGAAIIEPMRSLEDSALGSNSFSIRVNRSGDDGTFFSQGGAQGDYVSTFFLSRATSDPLAAVWIDEPSIPNNPHLPVSNSFDDSVSVETVRLEGEVLSSYLSGSNRDQIIDPSTLDAVSGAGFIAPLGSHFDGGSSVPVLTSIRFNLSDLDPTVRDAVVSGCKLYAYIEFGNLSIRIDPELQSGFLINVWPATSALAYDPQPTSLPTAGNATNYYNGLHYAHIYAPDNTARPIRWDAVASSPTIRTPDLSTQLQSGLQHANFSDPALDKYVVFSIDPRNIYDAGTSAYGLPSNFDNAPPREVMAHNPTDPDPGANANPRLVITYSLPDERAASATACTTVVAGAGQPRRARLAAVFRDVRIPKGASISEARLHLTPANDYLSSQDFRMNVYAAASTTADPLASNSPAPGVGGLGPSDNVVWSDPGRTNPDPAGLISSRTSQKQWTSFGEVSSPDLSRLISNIVSDSNWCGGQDIVVYIEPRLLDENSPDMSSDPSAPALPIVPIPDRDPLRAFHTFDSSPSRAPRLEIVFGEPADPNDACNVYERFFTGTFRPTYQDQNPSCRSRSMTYRANSGRQDEFAPQNERVHFVKYADIDLPADAEILSANFLLNNVRDPSAEGDVATFPQQLMLYTHIPPTLTDVLTDLGPSSGQRNAAGTSCQGQEMVNRQSSTPVVWNLGSEDWNDPDDPLFGGVSNVLRTTPEMGPQIQQAIDGPTWRDNPQIVLMMHANSSNTSRDNWRPFSFPVPRFFNPIIQPGTPQLSLQWRSRTVPSDIVVTHRERLIQTIREMSYNNPTTPIYAAVRESINYFRNEEVYYGRRRAPANDPDQADSSVPAFFGRVSTSDSHDGSVIVPPGCSGVLTRAECADLRLSPGARYRTDDVAAPCEANTIIFLMDGGSGGWDTDIIDSYRAWADSLLPSVSCGSGLECPTVAELPMFPGDERNNFYNNFLGEIHTHIKAMTYASGSNYSAPNNATNNQPIRIHTIGFGIGDEDTTSISLQRAQYAVRALADHGGGNSYLASNATELLLSLRSAVELAASATSSLAAPSLTINAFNSLFTLDEIFVSMFLPSSDDTIWPGNIKKFRLRDECLPADGADCTVGELLDSTGDRVLDASGRISADSRSLWSSITDGADVLAGGAGEVHGDQMPYPQSLFTDGGKSTSPGTSLDTEIGFNIIPGSETFLGTALGASPTTNDTELINWLRGTDVYDEDNDSDVSEDRWLLQDSIHTGILPINFGRDNSLTRPILKLVATTNAGEIRLINAEDGREEWRYIPRDRLAMANQVTQNIVPDSSENPSSTRFYGIDGPLSSMSFDCNRNGLIESNPATSDCPSLSREVMRDRVLVFATSRRGGDKIYAFELIPRATISSATSIDDITPSFLWTIDADSPGYSLLGQTWSQAVPMRINALLGNAGSPGSRLVVAFAGGYSGVNDIFNNPEEPRATSRDDEPGLTGSALYMADMFTGECVLYIGPVPQSGCEHSTVVPEMKYSIPMTPGFLNSGLQFSTPSARGVDRFYFADLGGQVFRVDLNVRNIESPANYAVVRKIADFGQVADGGAMAINERQFYNSPIVVPVRGDFTYSGTNPDYDLIIMSSGTRPFPRNTSVLDRAYVFRDVDATRVYDNTDTIIAIEEDDLFDASTALPEVDDLRSSSGFYLNFGDAADLKGEKAISLGTVLSGTWFFTTYSPEEVAVLGMCSQGTGISRFYAINLLDAQPTIDQNDDGLLEVSDRASVVSTGLVSDIATAFLRGGTALLVNTEGGSRTLDTGGALSNLDVPVVQSRRQW